MNWTAVAAWITALATVVLAAGVIVALVGFWDAKKTRHAALITDWSRRWDDPLTVESIELYSEHGPRGIIELADRLYAPDATTVIRDDLNLNSCLLRWPNLIEALGVLHDEGSLSTDVIAKMWGPQIIAAWAVWKEPVMHIRTLNPSFTTTYAYFQKLADALEAASAKELGAATGRPAT